MNARTRRILGLVCLAPAIMIAVAGTLVVFVGLWFTPAWPVALIADVAIAGGVGVALLEGA